MRSFIALRARPIRHTATTRRIEPQTAKEVHNTSSNRKGGGEYADGDTACRSLQLGGKPFGQMRVGSVFWFSNEIGKLFSLPGRSLQVEMGWKGEEDVRFSPASWFKASSLR